MGTNSIKEQLPHQIKSLLRVEDGVANQVEESVITEASITLHVNGEDWLTFLCTPLEIEELAAGFLFTARFIQSATEIASSRVCENGSVVDLWLTHTVEKPRLWQKNSGCSGGVSAPDLQLPPIPPSSRFNLDLQQINSILAEFYQSQSLYRVSGGLHSAALFSGTHLVYGAEDIGRHNTLDKIAGKLLLTGEDLTQRVLVSTGRVSLEMMQKAAALQSPFVISRTSPTSASVELAEQMGITLIGYANGSRLKIYTHPESILF